MRLLAWLVAVLLIVAGLYAVDWSVAVALAFVGLAVLLMAYVAAGSDDGGSQRGSWNRKRETGEGGYLHVIHRKLNGRGP